MFLDVVCDHVLGNITYDEIIDGARKSINEEEICDALYILAGLNKETSDYHDVIKYYEKAIDELKIKCISIRDAAIHITRNICKKYIDGDIEYYEFISSIKLRIYNKTIGKLNDTKFVGDNIGIHNIIGVYWEYEDYYNEEIKKNKIKKDELEEEINLLCRKYANEYLYTNFDLTIAST